MAVASNQFRARYRIKGTKLYMDASATGFDAASTRERVVNWRPNYGGPNTIVSGALPLLRARSRDAVRRDGLANQIIEILTSDVVGVGIKPQFITDDSGLNKALAELWDAWVSYSDTEDMLDFYGQQALAFRSCLEGGDMFTRFRVRRASDGLPVPMQLQLLEGEYCPVEMNQQVGKSNFIQSGVEFNAIGMREAFWLYQQHPYDYTLATQTSSPVRVPATEIAQVMIANRPGYVRGVPWLVRALVKLRDLDEYDDAQVIRQKIAALFAGFVKTAGTESDANIYSGQEPSEESGDAGVDIAPLQPGTMQILGPGQEMEWSSPPDAGNTYEPFIQHQERRIAVAGGVVYEQLSGDYRNVNDRTWRAAMIGYRRKCQALQFVFAKQFNMRTMNYWLNVVNISKMLSFPKNTPAENVKVKWLPQAWAYLNPVQDVEAKMLEMRNGLTSRAQLVSEQGYDIEQLDSEIAADNARADKLGLVLDSDPRKTARTGAATPEPAGGASAGTGGGDSAGQGTKIKIPLQV